MATARYWRLVGIKTYGSGDLELSGIHLYNAGGRLDETATVTASHTPTGGSLVNLQDDDVDTLCRFDGRTVRSPGFCIQWDMGTAVDVTKINLGSADEQATYTEILALESSTDAATWISGISVNRVLYPGARSWTLVSTSAAADYVWQDFGSQASADATGLIWTSSSYAGSAARASKGVSAGKWYWELKILSMNTSSGFGGNALNFGVWPVSRDMDTYIYETAGVYRSWQAAAPNDVFGFAFNADDGTLAVYRNATLVGSADGQPLSMTEPWAPVIGDDNGSGAFVQANFGLLPFAHTPPTGHIPLVVAEGVAPPLLTTGCVGGQLFASSPTAAQGVHFADCFFDSLAPYRDFEFGGVGRVAGTVKRDAEPDLPLRRRVRLHRERDGLLVREVWSDPVTGAYSFDHIDGTKAYTVVTYDHLHDYRAVIADNITPEPVP